MDLPQPVDADSLNRSAITQTVLKEWRVGRFGNANPEIMTNPFWEWMVRTKVNAWEAQKVFELPKPFGRDRYEATWCFDRMGQSVTRLPDGRTVMIAGEHEDGYDPDFRIYNDVTVWSPDGSLRIYGYPRDVFPPTDFHTATLLEGKILVIGNLGYIPDRKNETQVMELDLGSLAVRRVQTFGASPGWLHRHRTTLSADGKSVLVEGGEHYSGSAPKHVVFTENNNSWKLSLTDWKWEKTTDRGWTRRVFYCPDGETDALDYRIDFFISTLKRNPVASGGDSSPPLSAYNKEVQKEAAALREAGLSDDPQLALSLFKPAVAHTPVKPPQKGYDDDDDDQDDENRYGRPPAGNEYCTTRITVEGVTVSYLNRSETIHMTVEGKLPPETVDALCRDLTAKLEKMNGKPFLAEPF